MVCLDTSISEEVSKSSVTIMSNSKNRKINNSIGGQKIQSCDEWQFVVIDVVMFIAVVGAVGFLLYPYAKFVILGFVGMAAVGFSLVKEEVVYAPALYGSLALGMICTALASLMILIFTDANCGRPGCKGFRKAATFNIQVQTEEDLRNSLGNGSSSVKDVVKVGMTRFRREHIRELEGRLRKLAPTNGKAVLFYRAGCGCVAGKLEVAGPRCLPFRGKIKK